MQIRCYLETLQTTYEDFEDFSFQDIEAPNGNTTSIFSETTDEELLQACEGLDGVKTVYNKEDLDATRDKDMQETSSEGEPPAKRDKIEEFDYLSMLDSPPRQFTN